MGPRRGRLGSGILGLVGGLEELPDEFRDDGTDDRGDDEQPHLLDGKGASLDEHHECGSEGPGGVDGRSRESDGHEVDQDQGETDDESGLSGCCLGGGHSQSCEDEDEGHQDLDNQCAGDGDVRVRPQCSSPRSG